MREREWRERKTPVHPNSARALTSLAGAPPTVPGHTGWRARGRGVHSNGRQRPPMATTTTQERPRRARNRPPTLILTR